MHCSQDLLETVVKISMLYFISNWTIYVDTLSLIIINYVKKKKNIPQQAEKFVFII